MLFSSRLEMSQLMKQNNAQFITQVGLTVDRLNGVTSSTQTSDSSECLERLRSIAGDQIQEIIHDVMTDLDYYQRDYVYLLLDVTDQYISFNQKWPKSVLSEFNGVLQMDIINYMMETYIYFFYKSLFEAQIEEVLIEMGRFNDLVNITRIRAFVALTNVGERLERNAISCWKLFADKIVKIVFTQVLNRLFQNIIKL